MHAMHKLVVLIIFLINGWDRANSENCPRSSQAKQKCPTKKYLNPRNLECISEKDLEKIHPTANECLVWSDCGFCMHGNPFHDVASFCDNCINTPTERATEIAYNSCKQKCKVDTQMCDFAPTIVRMVPDCDLMCTCVDDISRKPKVPSKVVKNNECGLSSFTDPSFKIVGGLETEPGSFPWQVSLAYGLLTKLHRCGGALISKKAVLSAAHCVIGNWSLYCGILGKHHKTLDDVTQIVVTFLKIIKHAKFSKKDMANDIAIFFIKEDIEYTNYIRPICLCDRTPKNDENIIVTGWGETKDRSVSNEILRKVTIPTIDALSCNKKTYKTRSKIKPGMICAGLPEGGKDACQGDSGGPALSWRKSANKYYLSGIVSWGYGCGGKYSPGVYTNVCYFRGWINKYMKRKFKKSS